jgi:hypothetical protein
MANEFDTSFIPQQPLLRVEGGPSRREAVSFPLVLALVAFFATLVLAGGMYYYKVRADREVNDMTQELIAAEGEIDTSLIDRYKKLDTRLKVAKDLLSSHAAFSIVLNLLEDTSAQNIGLTELGYSEGDTGTIVNVSGVAVSYAAVYFQAESWRKMVPIVKDVSVGEVNLDETSGVIGFKADITLNSDRVRYGLLIEAENNSGSSKTDQDMP